LNSQRPPRSSAAATPPPAAGLGTWPRPAYAWYVVALLVLAYAFGVLDRIVMSLLVKPIKSDLHLSDAQIGYVQGFAFALFNSIFTIPVGVAIDRWKRLPIMWVGLALWSAATVASGLSKAFSSLFLARVVMGAGEATTVPGSASLIADCFPPVLRPRAYGVFTMGGSIGIGLAYVFGAIAISTASDLRRALPALLGGYSQWHIVFFMVGAPGLALAALMALTLHEPPRRGAFSASGSWSLRPLAEELGTNRGALTAVMLGSIMNVMIINAQLAWFPTLFERVYDWAPARTAFWLGWLGLPLGLGSALTAGWLLSALAQRGRRDGPVLIMMLQCVSWALFGTLKCLAPTPVWSLGLHVLTSLTATWALTATFSALNEVTPNQLRGQVVAVYAVISALVATAVGPAVVGLLSDHVFTAPTGIAPSLASINLVGGLVGVAVLVHGRHAFERAVERARDWGELPRNSV
jgi:MFS family permease